MCYITYMFKKGLLLALPLFLLLAASSQAAEQASYIVVFKDSANLKSEVSDLKAENPVPHVYDDVFKGANVLLSESEKADLLLDPAVRLIERDGIAQTTRSTSLWGLDRIDQRNLPLNSLFDASNNGAGVNAYVIDTGLRADHTQFTGRVLPGYTSILDGRGTGDCDGHGTHVAGTVAGSTYGVAPEAQVIPVRVLDCEGSGSWSGVIAGMDWAVGDHDANERAVANMSLGGGYIESVNLAVARMTADGIATVVAAGNENANACNTSPASAPSAITVGSTTSSDARSSFSNWGSCLDVFAPGSSILSAGISSSTSTSTKSGTSMASPHVAGAAALLLSSANSTPAGIETAIKDNATPGVLTDVASGSPNKLLYAGSDSSPPPPPPPPPENDNFANASNLTIGSISSSTLHATKESGEPTHVNSSTRSGTSVWYKWTPAVSGTLSLNTHGSAFDTLLAVYTGSSVSALTVRAANDDDSSGNFGYASKLSTTVTGGTTYHIVIDGYGAASGSFNLNASFVSLVPATPVISVKPDRYTQSRSASFAFSGEATLECRLNQSSWGLCASPKIYSDLDEGEYLFELRSVNASNQPSLVASYLWEVDRSAPATPIITAGPSESSALQAANFFFSGEQGATYSCSLDGAVEAPCVSPVSYNSLGYGSHTFRVRQIDRAGNASPLATRAWSVLPSTPTWVSTPPKETLERTAAFAFSGLESDSFLCSLDSGSWEPCLSPKAYTNLSLGAHTFAVKQVVSGVSSASLVYSWRITASTLAAPRITQAPSSSTSRSARFVFVGQEGARFQCRLNGSSWAPCSSPKVYRNLAVRKHTFSVRQISEGIVSPAASHSWSVRRARR